MTMFIWLVIEFFKTGLFAVGGGLATLPFLYEIAGKYDWLDPSMMGDMIAVSESTPGPIGVNMATYAGFNAGSGYGGFGYGVLGAVSATFALVLPSLIVIIIVAKFLNKFNENKLVKNAFDGLRPTVCGLIAAAAISVFESACLDVEKYKLTKKIVDLIDEKAVAMFIVFFVFSSIAKKCHPIFLIIPAAIIGIILKM